MAMKNFVDKQFKSHFDWNKKEHDRKARPETQ